MNGQYREGYENSEFDMVEEKNQVRLEELIGDREVEGHHGIHGRKGLHEDNLTH